MAMLRSLGLTCVMSWPAMRIAPPVIGSSPAMQFSRVDFPHPDGPTSTRKSPLSMLTLMSFQDFGRAVAF